jgi:SRSO17 transposase
VLFFYENFTDFEWYDKSNNPAERDRLKKFLSFRNACFKTSNSNQSIKAELYVCGLFQANRSNMEQMSEVVKDAGYHQIQHFISESPWDARIVMDSVATDTDKLFADFNEVHLLIDESAHTKKGTKSVGVARQYSGQPGKVDNCQVAVYAALSADKYCSLIDARLYLPEQWTSDKKRCKSAHIPPAEIKCKTKLELALEMIAYHKQKGTRFHWIGGDGLYGHDSKFRNNIAALGLLYMPDIHSTDGVYVEKPSISIPEKQHKRGRKPSLPKADKTRTKVCDIVKELSEQEWKTYTVRDTAKGPLIMDVWVQEIYTRDAPDTDCRKELLVVRRGENEKGVYEYKYSLSNGDINKYSWLQLARTQAQRYFIERGFEDAKQEAGMSQYQVRGWLAWHHHIGLVMLSMLFVLTEKLEYKNEYPLLTASDVRNIIARTYAQQDNVLEIMNQRHKRRQDDIDRHYKKIKAT